MIVAFYGFQQAPNVRQVEPTLGWRGWFSEKVEPLLESGIRDFHLHNPFGLHEYSDRLKPNGDPIMMHIDQFELARCKGLDWLANAREFSEVVNLIHRHGGRVSAYVGSPLVIPFSPSINQLRPFLHCNPEPSRPCYLFRWLKALRALCSLVPGMCERPFSCQLWKRFVKAHVQTLLDAQVDAVGFDSSYDFHPGDCMYQLVEELITSGIEVMIEPWPRNCRSYPQVSWIIREQKYREIKHRRRSDQAPLECVEGRPVFRIVPNHRGDEGREELRRIHELSGILYTSTQEVVDSVLRDGHIPMVRWHQLENGDVRIA